MTKPLATPGDIVDLRSLPTKWDTNHLASLVKTQDVEIIQLFIPAGAKIPTYEAEGEIILHCLKGQLSVSALGESHELTAGQLLYLALNERFSIEGIERASVIATIIAPKEGQNVELIGSQKPR